MSEFIDRLLDPKKPQEDNQQAQPVRPARDYKAQGPPPPPAGERTVI